MNFNLRRMHSQMKLMISCTSDTRESVDELHEKLDAVDATVAAIHADTRQTSSTFKEVAATNRAVHGEVQHVNQQITAMAVRQASTSDQLSEVIGTTSYIRAVVTNLKPDTYEVRNVSMQSSDSVDRKGRNRK